MTEFVLVLPLLAGIIALTFFFGWAMMHKEQVVMASRYSAWHRVDSGIWPTEEKINEVCFNDRANKVVLGTGPGVGDTARDLVAQTAGFGGNTELLADATVVQRFPGGHDAHVAANFDNTRAIWNKLGGDIHSQHAREGITWRRDEVGCWGVLRDIFYPDMDAQLERIAPPANGMAQMVRGLYLTHW
jgi:hypothetical protein